MATIVLVADRNFRTICPPVRDGQRYGRTLCGLEVGFLIGIPYSIDSLDEDLFETTANSSYYIHGPEVDFLFAAWCVTWNSLTINVMGVCKRFRLYGYIRYCSQVKRNNSVRSPVA